jgi:hypothetical protein
MALHTIPDVFRAEKVRNYKTDNVFGQDGREMFFGKDSKALGAQRSVQVVPPHD